MFSSRHNRRLYGGCLTAALLLCLAITAGGCLGTTTRNSTQALTAGNLTLPPGAVVATGGGGGNGEPYIGGNGLNDLMLLSGSRFYEPIQAESPICPSGQPRTSTDAATRVFTKVSPTLQAVPYLESDSCDPSGARALDPSETEAVAFLPISNDLDSFQIGAFKGKLLLSLGNAAAPPATMPARRPEVWCSDTDHSPSRVQIYVRSSGDGQPYEARLKVFLDPYTAPTPELDGSPATFAGPFALTRSVSGAVATYSAAGFVLRVDTASSAGPEATLGRWKASMAGSVYEGNLRCRAQLVSP